MGKHDKKAIICAAGCSILTFAVTGLISCPTVFLGAVSQGLGVGVGKLSLYVTIQNLAMALSVPLSIRLITGFDERAVMSCALFLACGAVFAMSFLHTLLGFYLAAALAGVALSFLSYLVIPIIVTPYFPDNPGTALAVVLGFIGLGSSFFNTLISRVITGMGWRYGYAVLALIVFILGLPCTLFLIRRKPRASVDAPERANEKAFDNGNDKRGCLRLALRTPRFYLGLCTVICFCMIASAYHHMTGFVASMGYRLEDAAAVASIYMIGVTAGKFVIGISNDRIGLQRTLLIVGIVSCICAGLFTAHPFGYVPLMVCAFLLGIGAANNSLLSPLLIRALYEEENYEEMISVFSMVTGTVSALAISMFGMIYDISGKYEYVFALLTLLIAAGSLSGSLCLGKGKSIIKLFYHSKKDMY